MLLADAVQDAFGNIGKPSQLANFQDGSKGINQLLNNAVGIFFSAGALVFIIMFVWGAVQMILSGGDKEAIAKARSRITWAIVGIALLSLSYLIFFLLQTITGFSFFTNGA